MNRRVAETQRKNSRVQGPRYNSESVRSLRLCVSAVIIAASVARSGELSRHEFSEPHMGTMFRIVLYAKDDTAAMNASRAAFDRIEQLNNVMSDYKADSELMNLV